MQVMIVEEDAVLRTRITGALAPEGVDILSFGRLGPAKDAARRAAVDILVLGESVEGRIASDVALLAEWRNPRLGSILLSDRGPEEAEELFDLIPSLQAVLARDTGPRTLARLAIVTARAQEGIVLPHEPEDAAEPDEPQAEAPPTGAPRAEAPPLEEDISRERTPPAPAPAAGPVARLSRLALPGPVVPAHPETDHAHEVITLIREVLAQVETAQASPFSAPPAPVPQPATPLWPVTVPEAPAGRLYVLPNFLRDDEEGDTEEADDEERDDPALPVTPAQAAQAAQAALSTRRLNLA